MASIKYQVVDTLQRCTVPMMDSSTINNQNIPTSRHDMKADDRDGKWSHLIFSYSTYDTYRDRCINFAKYCKKEYNIRNLNEIKPEMVKSYFESRSKLSAWTLKGDYSAISKLENALQNRNWLGKNEGFQLDTKELGLEKRDISDRVKGGPYSDTEVQSIKENVSDNVRKYVEFAKETGARVHEIQAVEIISENRIKLTGKGGREREVEVSKEFVLQLEKKIQKGENVVPDISKRAVQKSIASACEKLEIKSRGIHGIRANAAVNHYNAKRAAGYSVNDAKKSTSRFLGHNRLSVVRFYLD